MNIIRGKVRKGDNRGKKLGFPTANINLWKSISTGIYISKTKVSGVFFPSLTFIGKAGTFGKTKVQAETYIFEFAQIIYNQWISIILLKKIRESKKFKTAEDLISQMEKDEKKARQYFNLT